MTLSVVFVSTVDFDALCHRAQKEPGEHDQPRLRTVAGNFGIPLATMFHSHTHTLTHRPPPTPYGIFRPAALAVKTSGGIRGVNASENRCVLAGDSL